MMFMNKIFLKLKIALQSHTTNKYRTKNTTTTTIISSTQEHIYYDIYIYTYRCMNEIL